jgi:hypothetical protein
MGRNTLKGKVKVLSYFAAFLFMVGVHIAMDRIANNRQIIENKEEAEYISQSGNNITVGDSLSDIRKEKSGTIMLFKTDYN